MRTALVDGDILIYRSACAAEKETRWPDGRWTYEADENEGIKILNKLLSDILEETGTENYRLCFSDLKNNFRKQVYPPYKNNRKDTKKPLLFKVLREYCFTKLQSYVFEDIEADDLMGIYATDNDDCFIVTVDKDLLQIPVPVYNFDTKVWQLPEHRDCEGLFYTQVLTGDPVDGYPGCPGIGPNGAEEILKEPRKWVKKDHTFKSGKRKGQVEVRWKKEETPCDIWESIVSHYEKAGQTEADALAQARCAYILHAKNYDDSNGAVRLWEYEKGNTDEEEQERE